MWRVDKMNVGYDDDDNNDKKKQQQQTIREKHK